MKTQTNGMDVYTIQATDGAAASIVPDMGAAVSSLLLPGPDGPAEMLFLHPFFWEKDNERTRGGFPFIFPICGRLERDGQAGAYLYNAHRYTMPSHGFSMRMPWTVVEEADDRLTLALHDTDQTQAQYPFSFELTLTFRMEPGTFLIEQKYTNTGDTAMPYYAGFHPYFLTPNPSAGKKDVMLDFQPVRGLAYNEELTDLAGERDLPAIPVSVSDPAINEALTMVGADKEAQLQYPNGTTLHMRADGNEDPNLFAYIQFYTIPDQPFFCVEPWMAFPNALNTVAGCRQLPPNSSESGTLKVWTTTEKRA